MRAPDRGRPCAGFSPQNHQKGLAALCFWCVHDLAQGTTANGSVTGRRNVGAGRALAAVLQRVKAAQRPWLQTSDDCSPELAGTRYHQPWTHRLIGYKIHTQVRSNSYDAVCRAAPPALSAILLVSVRRGPPRRACCRAPHRGGSSSFGIGKSMHEFESDW
jgi:hypothetical protein